MATKRPSFLKRQKEQKRSARALEKRQARREREEARKTARTVTPVPELPLQAFPGDRLQADAAALPSGTISRWATASTRKPPRA
jgi:hypothetical protein